MKKSGKITVKVLNDFCFSFIFYDGKKYIIDLKEIKRVLRKYQECSQTLLAEIISDISAFFIDRKAKVKFNLNGSDIIMEVIPEKYAIRKEYFSVKNGAYSITLKMF